jgi:uncharacterized membrane protein
MVERGSAERASGDGALVAWTFGSRSAVEQPPEELDDLESHGVVSWATVSWPRGAPAPRMWSSDSTDSAGFWSLVLGIAYLVPLLGVASDTPRLTLPTLEFVGVSQEFVNRLRDHLVPGASQLLAVLPADAYPTVDTLVHHLRPVNQALHPLAAGQLAGITELYLR